MGIGFRGFFCLFCFFILIDYRKIHADNQPHKTPSIKYIGENLGKNVHTDFSLDEHLPHNNTQSFFFVNKSV